MISYPENQRQRHIVFFKIYENTDEAKIQEAIQLLKQLGKDRKGILDWTVTETLDTRKGRIIIENGLFADSNTLEVFRASPEHQKVAEVLGDIANWLVGDYYEPQHR